GAGHRCAGTGGAAGRRVARRLDLRGTRDAGARPVVGRAAAGAGRPPPGPRPGGGAVPQRYAGAEGTAVSLGWEDLRETIGARIRAREWPPGALIPAEAQLAADYGVARATVNRALQSLAEDGVIERRKRAGTRVAELPARR